MSDQTDPIRVWLRPVSEETVTRLASSRGWRLEQDSPPALGTPRQLGFRTADGASVVWESRPEPFVQSLLVPPRLVEPLEQALPAWPLQAIVEQAQHAGALVDRLSATRTWAYFAATENPEDAAWVEGLRALARHESTVARLCGLELCYLAVEHHRDTIGALAGECAGSDAELADSWRELVEVCAKLDS
jgi:hypothetical protein